MCDGDLDCTVTGVATAEKATNTECGVTGPIVLGGTRPRHDQAAPHRSKGPTLGPVVGPISAMMGPALIKRSQTFTPSAAASPASYICRVGFF